MNLARQDGAVRKFELSYRHWGAMEGFRAEESHDEFETNVDVTIY